MPSDFADGQFKTDPVLVDPSENGGPWVLDTLRFVDNHGAYFQGHGLDLGPASGGEYGIQYQSSLDPTYEPAPFNTTGLYYENGDFISFDVNHQNIESQLSYTRVQDSWGDSLDWLNIDSAA